MKVLLWKMLVLVPLGAFICYFFLSKVPGLEQAEAAQQKQRALSAIRMNPADGRLGAAAVLAIDPKSRPNPLPVKSAASPGPATFTLGSQVANARQYKPLHDRLKSGEGDTPEGWYAKYVILRACATVTDRPANVPRVATPELRRQRFIAGLSDADPQQAVRIAAFEQLDQNRCVGLEGFATTTEAELTQLLDAAAKAGDAKARTAQVERDMWAAYRASGNGAPATPAHDAGPGLPLLSDGQLDALKAGVVSRDPEAMIVAGRVLSNSIYDLTLQIGPDWQNIDHAAFNNAWQLLACEYGMECGNEHAKVLSACAYQGHCGATTLADNLYFYGNSPHQSQLLEQYRATLRQIVESGDWSQIRFTRGGSPVGSRYFVRGGPGA